MKIKNGDIITLENGDIAKVSLKIIEKKVKKLIPGKWYELGNTSNFCHYTNLATEVKSTNDYPKGVYQYVGKVDTEFGVRNIFYKTSSYLMFSDVSLNYVIKQIKKQ